MAVKREYISKCKEPGDITTMNWIGIESKLCQIESSLVSSESPRLVCDSLFMAALWDRAGHYIFALWLLSIYLSIFFSSPNLSGRKLDVYHTSTHGVALVRI